MQNEEKKTSRHINVLLVSLAAVMLIASIVIFVSTMMKFNDRNEQIEKLRAEKKALEEKIDELNDKLDRVMDEEYIAGIAHDKLNMYYPDEIIYYDGSETKP